MGGWIEVKGERKRKRKRANEKGEDHDSAVPDTDLVVEANLVRL